ncbi:MAG TPA: glycosyltransferase [Coriobacteriia bacterium]|nr:glycosyltransferase [Coriobacteriia bacterium]
MSEVSVARITFGIIARRRIPELERLVAHLLSLVPQGEGEVVVAIESSQVSKPAECADGAARWIDVPERHGLGYNRNRVIDAARGEILVWADDDCMPQPGWLESLLAALEDPAAAAVAGVLRIPPAGFVGDSISALGFPAGGNAGYATMFVVRADGTTENLPSGNSAIRLSVLREMGGYDESMWHGGEDTELSHRLNVAGKRIMFAPEAVLEHPARTSIGEFVRWSFRRGRAKREFARRVAIGGYVGQRLGSFGKILKANARSAKILLVAPLLVVNLAWQYFGFVAESLSPTPPPAPTPGSTLGRGFESA